MADAYVAAGASGVFPFAVSRDNALYYSAQALMINWGILPIAYVSGLVWVWDRSLHLSDAT